jgi:hypothetical protein
MRRDQVLIANRFVLKPKSVMKTPKTWIITAALRGFGFEISKAVLDTGDNVVARVRSKPEELASRLGSRPHLHVALLDINDEAQDARLPRRRWKNLAPSTSWPITPASACWVASRKSATRKPAVSMTPTFSACSRLAAAIVRLAASPKPPVHLPSGKDNLARYRAKIAAFEKEINEWQDVITGTGHDDVAAA